MTTYVGLLVSQHGKKRGAPRFFVFVDSAASILAWAEIRRTAEVPGGAQRLFSQTHANSVAAFLEHPKNIVPTAVTLAVKPGTYSLTSLELPPNGTLPTNVSLARLKLKKRSKGTIIDGQHRLFGLKDEGVPLLGCVVLGADSVEEALQFVVINNKSKRVPPDLVKAILSELSEEERSTFDQRIARIHLSLGRYHTAIKYLNDDKDSPFYDLVDWDANRSGERRIKPLALETSLKVIVSSLKVGVLDLDDAVDVLSALWRGVKAAYTGTMVWADESSNLLLKAAIVAVTELLVARMNVRIEDGFDVGNPEAISEFATNIMSTVPSDFWMRRWARKGLDTSAGRRLIQEALSDIRRATAQRHEDPLSTVEWFLNEAEDNPKDEDIS